MANRFQGSRAVGGKLFVTDRRLLFNPHRLDGALGGTTWQAELGSVRSVAREPKVSGKASAFGGGLRDRLKVVLEDGSEEIFVTNKLDEAISRVAQARAEAP